VIAPPSLTIWHAAPPRDSQLFLLVGGGVMIPIILAYTGNGDWVFRGTVRADEPIGLVCRIMSALGERDCRAGLSASRAAAGLNVSANPGAAGASGGEPDQVVSL
jgi:hypothetical protein